MAQSGTKAITLDFSNMASGMNTVDTPTQLRKGQVQSAVNAVMGSRGFQTAQGYLGLSATDLFLNSVKGIHVHQFTDGTEALLTVSNGHVYAVNTSTGALTDLFTISGTGEAYFASAFNKCFAVNGTGAVKVESATTAYNIGIVAPSGVTAAKAAGGSLTAGVYKIYVCYGRKVGGTIVLYSQGQTIGDVTLSGGDLSITFSNFANSSDSQVNTKIVFMTDADGATYYFYHDTNDNTTTSFTITATTNRNTSLLYTVEASLNYVPPALKGLIMHDRKLIGWLNDVVYYSLRFGNVYDLERWNTASNGQIITYPHTVISLFSMGAHLYINTVAGIIMQPYADWSQKYEIMDRRWYYRFPKTVDNWGSQVIGMTNDGLRIFDGEKFSTFDLSKDIKPEIDRLYSSYSSDYEPCGKVVRRENRTEYHLSFRDTNTGTALNNRWFVLNLDDVVIRDSDNYRTPWEEIDLGFAYATSAKDNTNYFAQSKEGGACIFKERGSETRRKYVYTKAGAWLAAETDRTLKIITRQDITNITGIVRWHTLHVYSKGKSAFTVKVVIIDKAGRYRIKTVTPSTDGVSVFGTAIFGVSVFSSETPLLRKIKLPMSIKGRGVYLEVEQTTNDPTMTVYELVLSGTLIKNRFT